MRRPFTNLLGAILAASFLGSRPPSRDALEKPPDVSEASVETAPVEATPRTETAERALLVVKRGPLLVRNAPSKSARTIGTLAVGASIEFGTNAPEGWLEISPRGYVRFDPKLLEIEKGAPRDAELPRFEFIEAAPGTRRFFSSTTTRFDFSRVETLARRSFFRVERHVDRHGDSLLEVGDGSFFREGDVAPLDASVFVGGPQSRDDSPELETKLDESACRRLFGKCPKRLIEVGAKSGFLYLHEDGRPIYFTRISAGRLGTATPEDGLRVAPGKTPLGVFSVLTKHRLLTMTSAGSSVIHQDVPWTLHFSGPYALHVAYWHDDFGTPKSGGCINLSPRDGKIVFDFSTPKLPLGWHSVSAHESGESPTLVWIHE